MADTPKFVGLVVEGDGFVLNVRSRNTKEECERVTLEEWQNEQKEWEASPADERAPDPPMWDIYERIRPAATVVHPANQAAS